MDGDERTASVVRPGDTTSEDFRAWRDSMWEQHPVVTWNAEFLLPTPAIEEIGELVSSDIYLARSGTAYWAKTRFGKSHAIFYLINRIQETFNKVPIIRIDAKFNAQPSKLAFCHDLLKASHFALREARTGSGRGEQAMDLFLSIGKNGDGRRLVVFVDEAQNWSEAEWTWLKEMQVFLYANLILMVVIPFGQEQLLHRRTALKQSGRKDLIERFLSRCERFRGVVDVSDARRIMGSFDTTDFPLGSGVSLSEFFRPKAFHAGWRFAQECQRSIDAFLTAGGTQEIGMEWIALAWKYFLTEFSDEDQSGWAGTQAHWQKAVKFSGWGHDDDDRN